MAKYTVAITTTILSLSLRSPQCRVILLYQFTHVDVELAKVLRKLVS